MAVRARRPVRLGNRVGPDPRQLREHPVPFPREHVLGKIGSRHDVLQDIEALIRRCNALFNGEPVPATKVAARRFLEHTGAALQSASGDGDGERARLLEPITRPLVLVVVGGAVVWMVVGFAAFAWGRGLPLFAVDHLEGHLVSPFLDLDDDASVPGFWND